jgi:excisionase family DNA binding protein
MAAVGNLNDYVKYQMAQGMAEGGGGPAGAAAEIAMGFGMAQQMMKEGFLGGQSTPPAGGAPTAVGAAPSAAAPALLSPAQVAQQLGVSEADVFATLEAGELKGKKIGTQWRITNEALQEFLKH